MPNTLGSIELPDDMNYSTEFDGSDVAQSVRRSLTGANIISESLKIKGKKIVLTSGEDYAWMPRSKVKALYALANTLDNTIPLVFNGETYNVRFDRSVAPVKATQIIDCSDPSDDDPYSVILSFIEVV